MTVAFGKETSNTLAVDDTLIDFAVGEEAVEILARELGKDFLNSYKKVRDLVMQKRIGQDYLLSRRVTCTHTKFLDEYPNIDDVTFSLLITDLVIRGEAILLALRKKTGIDAMKRYNEIKKSIIKRKLKKKPNKDKRLNKLIETPKQIPGFTRTHPVFSLVENSFTRVMESLGYYFKRLYIILLNELKRIFV